MRYVIIGPGGVGGIIGARLHATGRDVVLVARGEHLRAIQTAGLRLVTPEGEATHQIPAFGHPSDVGLQPDDVVVIATKSQHTAGVLDDLRATAPDGLAVLCAQNGVANERAALRLFADVYSTCVMLPGAHFQPGVVIQYSAPSAGVLDIGCYPGGVDDRAVAISADLAAAGFRSQPDPAIMRQKHRKLITNLANAVDALCGAGARGSDLSTRVWAEGEACLKAAGIDVQTKEEDAARRDGGVSMHAIEGYPPHGSSSFQSLLRGAGSIEADWLNGEIVLLGRLHGVPTPLNALLQREANAAARAGMPPGSFTVEELESRL